MIGASRTLMGLKGAKTATGEAMREKGAALLCKGVLISLYTFMGTVQIIIGIQRRDFWCSIVGACFILVCLFLSWDDGRRNANR